jgi:hypothetical protein
LQAGQVRVRRNRVLMADINNGFMGRFPFP